MKSLKKTTTKKEVKPVESKKNVKKVIVRPAAKTTTSVSKNAAPKELKTVIAQEKVQTAEGWKRAMLLEKKAAASKQK